ncbi:Fcf1-domain-containing protein [Wallemia mellicola]|uniref:Fcf1-domain-containing protein n=3 Tax=Wallemia mellicola TaxID=1708541 RepID=A0A4T0NLX4_9BASI|nr:Fcf1-domain-containing protein [Wallemia mellicola]TIB98081.1 Fcf1-domain-containing protein [Wallemia mellicola]TIC03166.1 Fcf1-domain-containing protein [Wallemia mellicola]TIC12689.1 Fcf1-domain-containing protein [Wallemia mellicola]
MLVAVMGKAKKTRNFAQVKRMLNPNDPRLKHNQEKAAAKEKQEKEKAVKHTPQMSHSLFFSHNEALAPPYHVLVDTNFINFSLQNKLDLVQGMMDCLFAKCIPCISDCVIAELEKLGTKYRMALRVAKDPRFLRLPCSHTGTYADDCIVQRIQAHKCYIVATCDRELRRRVRKVPGIPLMYIVSHRYAIERLPDQGAPL